MCPLEIIAWSRRAGRSYGTHAASHSPVKRQIGLASLAFTVCNLKWTAQIFGIEAKH
jgi:hypothetical protein